MPAVRIEYLGDLHCKAVHTDSGAVLTTDAPKDNQGLGEGFSPTDLLATALGTCFLSVMGIRARALGIDIGGARAEVEKHMVNAPSRRIDRLVAHIHMPHGIAPEHRRALEAAAHACPVHKALHPEVGMVLAFDWG